MRIAIWHNLPSGGGKRALFHQVQGLLARGHTVEAWCPAHADHSFLALDRLIPEHVLPCPPLVWQPTYPTGGLRGFWRHYKNTRYVLAALDRHALQCAQAIEQGQFDVLLVHTCMYVRIPAIGRHTALPNVLYLHEPYRQLYEADPQLPWVAADWPARFWRSPRALGRFVLDAFLIQSLRFMVREQLVSVRAFDRLLVNSLYSRESVLRAFGLDATLCYLGVEAAQFRATGAPRERFVVSLGALHPTKRVDLAIRALAAIPLERRPELVWIANFADHAYRQQVEALAHQCQVRFTVHVGIEDTAVVDWLSRAAVMLYTARLEPFGFAPLEANACETPVVAVAEGGVRETVIAGLNGLLVEGTDPEALGAAVLQLLDNPTLARRLGQAGRRQVLEQWQWPHSIDRLESQLFDVVNINRAPSPPQ